MPSTQFKNDLGDILFWSCCRIHFSLSHYVPRFSRIDPLDGQGRYVWQIVRSRDQRPVSSVQSHALRVQSPKSSVQNPESNCCVQSSWIPVCHVFLVKILHLLFLEKNICYICKTPKNFFLQWYTKHYIILTENCSTHFL